MATIYLKNLREDVFKVILAVTYKCNYKCLICNIWRLYLHEPSKAKLELKLDEIKEVFKKSKPVWISLTGGEPFLRNDIIEIVQAVYEESENLKIINVSTNGSLPDRIEKVVAEVIEEIKVPLMYVTVSLDGDRNRHDLIRGVKGAWEKALETFFRLHQLSTYYQNLLVGFEYTISPFNAGSLSSLYAELRKLGLFDVDLVVTVVHVGNYYHNYQMKIMNGFEYRSMALKDVELSIKYSLNALNLHSLIKLIYLKLLRKYLLESKRPVPFCTAASGTCFVDPYGNTYPCIIKDDVVVSLRKMDYDLKKIMSSNSFTCFKRIAKKGLCLDCWTPCEAYPSIIVNPILSFIKSIF